VKTTKAIRGSTESVLRDLVMTTPEGRRWRERALRRIEARRLRESKVARRSERAWGMADGGSGYQERRAVTAVLLGPKRKKRGAVVYASLAGEGRDEERRHGVKVKSFKADLRRKLKLRKAMSKGEALKLRKRARAAEAAITRAKVRAATAAFDAGDAPAREAAAKLGDARLLAAARRAAKLVEAASGRALSAALRRRVEALRAEVVEILKALGRPMERKAVDRGRGLGNDTSNLRPGDAEADGARGEISQLMEPEGTRGPSKPDGMGGDSLYCEDCAAGDCEEHELEEAADLQNAGMDADAAEEPDDDDLDPAVDEEDGSEDDEGKASKEAVNYRYASDPRRSCGRCAHFRGPAGCELVAGMILKVDTCDLFEPRGAR